MYIAQTIAIGISLLSTLASTQDDKPAIDKPPLHSNLDYLHEGLEKSFPISGHPKPHKWDNDWIPEYCLDKSKGERQEDGTISNGFNPADISTYDIKYDDCDTAWVVCVHKESALKIGELADLFGKIPVASRTLVRHVVSLPDDAGHAYNQGGDVVLFDIGLDGFGVLLHETAHSLDARAYREALSSSQHWSDELAQDSAIPDDYAGASLAENVAQATVIAAYNEVVPGGFPPIEPRWADIRHQYETVITLQREEAGSILEPGGKCRERLVNSKPVEKPNNGKKLLRGRWAPWRRSEMPDVSLAEGIKVIEPMNFDSGHCGLDIESKAWGPARKLVEKVTDVVEGV
ncbi:MAG: hypothetical protein Q9169_003528 [Polycauliona sp. 2 TL-2023]